MRGRPNLRVTHCRIWHLSSGRTWLSRLAAHGRDAVVKIGHLIDQLVESPRYRFRQRQRRQRGQDHLAVAGGLALVAEADRSVGTVKLREHEIVTERIGVAALGKHVVMAAESFGALIELIYIGQNA